MKFFLSFLILAVANSAFGIRLDGFRVKHSFSSSLRDKENFFEIPRNVKDATSMGYVDIPRTHENGFELSLKCLEGDYRVCPLYDKNGYIAGLQIAIPFHDLQSLPYVASSKMTLRTILGEDYWTAVSYVISPDTIRAGGRHGPIDETIEGIWVENGKKIMQIPLGESELSSQTLFKKQNCIPNMGTHYHYNMTEEMDCDSFFPYFVLVKEGRAIGLGWQIIGRTPEKGRKWFEDPPARAVEMTIPSAPSCLKDWVDTYGAISLHMYYIEKPWKITCEDEDSLQPMSIVNKFLLNTSRYANKVVDGAKKLFG